MLADRRRMGRGALGLSELGGAFLLAALLVTAVVVGGAAADPFYMGADISLETFMQQQNPLTLQTNATFYDTVNGSPVAAPLDSILYDHGANLFRLRIFVNPQTTYTNTNSGAIQTTAYDIALAQQIKAHCPNSKLLLDFMYSDTWADPGKQGKPAAWTNIPLSDPVNHTDLLTKVQTYTQDTLQAFKDAGVMPQMVQVGNEISSGMLWGTGTGTNSQGGKLVFSGSTSTQQASWHNLGLLLNSAIQGVRAAQGDGPKVEVAIHIDQGDQNGHPQYYFGNITNPSWGNVTDFDTIGVSYYPTTSTAKPNDSFAYLQANLNAVATTFPDKKVMVLETAYPWQNSSLGNDSWAKTPEGQQSFMSDLQSLMLNLPNNAGEGIVYWYPEAVPVSGYQIYNSGATALFDSSHLALPAVSTFGITLRPGDYDHDGIIDAGDYTIWRDTYGSTTDLRADGDGDGVIGPGDYDYWVARYSAGAGAGSGAAVTSSVPEPPSWILGIGLVAAMIGAWRGSDFLFARQNG